MIFVTVGSQKFQFDRLVKAVDDLVGSHEIRDEVFAQIGHCAYLPQNCLYKRFLDRDEFALKLGLCDIVINKHLCIYMRLCDESSHWEIVPMRRFLFVWRGNYPVISELVGRPDQGVFPPRFF